MGTYSVTFKRENRTVEFTSTLSEVEVVTGLKKVPGDFALSLRRTRVWSDSQERWARYMVEKAEGRIVDEQPKVEQPAGMGAIVELFAHASSSLQYPRVTFATSAGTVRIQRAGQASRYAGDLMVTDGQGYSQSRFYGRIDKAGAFHPGRDFSGAVTKVLAEIAADPAEALGRLGKAQGECCFCSKGLTDEASTAHGYGPVCAKNWGLPHGAAKIKVG